MMALVIDDSRAMRMVLGRMLSGLGFEVQDAAGGPAALELLAAGRHPDVILVDWHMPDMVGIDVVAAVRAQPLGYTGKIVMVTTETEQSQMVRALEAGADEYLMKPFTADAVEEKLRLLDLV